VSGEVDIGVQRSDFRPGGALEVDGNGLTAEIVEAKIGVKSVTRCQTCQYGGCLAGLGIAPSHRWNRLAEGPALSFRGCSGCQDDLRQSRSHGHAPGTVVAQCRDDVRQSTLRSRGDRDGSIDPRVGL